MSHALPPVCFILALLALVSGFALLAQGDPEVGFELHQARVRGDEEMVEILESRLTRRVWSRRALVGGLFVFAILFTVAGFSTMKGPPARPGDN